MSKECPIYGCKHAIGDEHLMCSHHFKMIPRMLQCEYFGEMRRVKAGESPQKLIEIEKEAVESVAMEASYRRSMALTMLERAEAIFA